MRYRPSFHEEQNDDNSGKAGLAYIQSFHDNENYYLVKKERQMLLTQCLSLTLLLVGRHEYLRCQLQKTRHLTRLYQHIHGQDGSNIHRRYVIFLPIVGSVAAGATPSMDHISSSKGTQSLRLQVVQDPDTYQAVVYTPANTSRTRYPLLLILHGAGRNDSNDAVQALLYSGEHMGLAPDLFHRNQAPDILADNFIVVTPYVGQGKRSFFTEPRSKILQFLDWFCSQSAWSNSVDGNARFLFGFSEGANVAVELATTRQFRAVVIAAYGFSGVLPTRALSLLQNIPLWVFHSADDVIYNVEFSDKLVQSLRSVANDKHLVRYTRYESDPEGFTGAVQGHSTGITASKYPELYAWMLSFC